MPALSLVVPNDEGGCTPPPAPNVITAWVPRLDDDQQFDPAFLSEVQLRLGATLDLVQAQQAALVAIPAAYYVLLVEWLAAALRARTASALVVGSARHARAFLVDAHRDAVTAERAALSRVVDMVEEMHRQQQMSAATQAASERHDLLNKVFRGPVANA